MATFRYSAVKIDGSVLEGEMDASDRSEAFKRLGHLGLQPVSLEDTAAPAGKSRRKAGAAAAEEDDGMPKGPVKLKRAQVVLFTEELSDMLAAGLQLEPALRVMENREELSALKDVTILLRQQVRDGTSFSRSLRNSSPSFGDLYCSMAAAGEVSGALPIILKRQAEYLTTLQDLQGKVIFALIYPSFLIGSGIAVTVLFVTFLIPQLMGLIDATQSNIPLAAKFMMGMSDVFKTYWWLGGILLIFAFLAFKMYLKDEKRRAKWHKIQLRLPIVGKVFQSRFFVQCMETLANLVGNGMPLLKGLELTRNTTINLYLRGKMDQLVAIVAEGGALSRAMKRAGFFPALLIDMVAVGEQTGDIEASLRRASERYDKELAKSIERMSALIQPVIVVIMAGVVGTMAYLMISIIFETISGLNSSK